MYPRMLVTVDEDMQPVPISVRVGQAVDTVGQAGKPKTITGFQTHTTPVRCATLVTLVKIVFLWLTTVIRGWR